MAESRETARKLKVDDRVEFIQRSFFDVDVSPATVVTLYLGQELNAAPAAEAPEELRKGSRIVSQRVRHGRLGARQDVTVRSKDKEHRR